MVGFRLYLCCLLCNQCNSASVLKNEYFIFLFLSSFSIPYLQTHNKVPLNDKSNLRQRSISIDREEEEGMEGLEEPLKAKKRRESRQGNLPSR